MGRAMAVSATSEFGCVLAGLRTGAAEMPTQSHLQESVREVEACATCHISKGLAERNGLAWYESIPQAINSHRWLPVMRYSALGMATSSKCAFLQSEPLFVAHCRGPFRHDERVAA